MNLEELALSMLNCEQTKNQTVFQHGVSVYEYFLKLKESETKDFKLPKWFIHKDFIYSNLYNDETICLYTKFHDCGKPIVRTVDFEGKIHFPNHAEVSKKIFFEVTGDELISNLIGWDMVLHTSTADEIDNYLKNIWSIKDSFTLLLVSLAEIHSNANLFGGIESDSFKSKFKKIEQRGTQICKYYMQTNK